MRLTLLPLLLLTLLTACADDPVRTRDTAPDGSPLRALGDACTASEQCPIDSACAGCTAQDARCTSGCGDDADCAVGHCVVVACVTCPCTGRCER